MQPVWMKTFIFRSGLSEVNVFRRRREDYKLDVFLLLLLTSVVSRQIALSKHTRTITGRKISNDLSTPSFHKILIFHSHRLTESILVPRSFRKLILNNSQWQRKVAISRGIRDSVVLKDSKDVACNKKNFQKCSEQMKIFHFHS